MIQLLLTKEFERSQKAVILTVSRLLDVSRRFGKHLVVFANHDEAATYGHEFHTAPPFVLLPPPVKLNDCSSGYTYRHAGRSRRAIAVGATADRNAGDWNPTRYPGLPPSDLWRKSGDTSFASPNSLEPTDLAEAKGSLQKGAKGLLQEQET